MAKIQDKYNSLRAYSQVARPDWLWSVRPEDKIFSVFISERNIAYFKILFIIDEPLNMHNSMF